MDLPFQLCHGEETGNTKHRSVRLVKPVSKSDHQLHTMRVIKPLSHRRDHRDRDPIGNNDDSDYRNATRIHYRSQDDYTAHTTDGDQNCQRSRNDYSYFDSTRLQHGHDNHNEHVSDHNDKLGLCSTIFIFGMWWL